MVKSSRAEFARREKRERAFVHFAAFRTHEHVGRTSATQRSRSLSRVPSRRENLFFLVVDLIEKIFVTDCTGGRFRATMTMTIANNF